MNYHSRFPLWFFAGLLAAGGLAALGAVVHRVMSATPPSLWGLGCGMLMLVAALILCLQRDR